MLQHILGCDNLLYEMLSDLVYRFKVTCQKDILIDLSLEVFHILIEQG
jgi:hypothetical protein